MIFLNNAVIYTDCCINMRESFAELHGFKTHLYKKKYENSVADKITSMRLPTDKFPC